MIQIEKLIVRFGDLEALSLAALTVGAGDRLAVVGPNGCGKSTLLRVLAGLQVPTSGRVSGCPPRGDVTLVHQRPHLFRGTVHENVAWAAQLRGRSKEEAPRWMGRLGISALSNRDARALSGGEQRRVALARALAAGPSVLLLDEPFAGLDDTGAGSLRAALQEFEGTLVVAGPEVDRTIVENSVQLGT